MKTPEQWLEEFHWCGWYGVDYDKAEAVRKIIQAIQKDAVESCAQLVHDMSRGTKSEERAIAIDEARDLLLSELKSLRSFLHNELHKVNFGRKP